MYETLANLLARWNVGHCDVKSADRNMNLRCHQYVVGLHLNTASLSPGSLCKMLDSAVKVFLTHKSGSNGFAVVPPEWTIFTNILN